MGRRKEPGTGVIAAAIFIALVSEPQAAAKPPKEHSAPAPPAATAGATRPAAPEALRLVPKARRMSTYALGARFEITTRDISFEAPAAYQEGFNFWAGRMKGQKRSEACEITTITQDADDSGAVVFRRTIPKFDVELQRNGQIFAPEVDAQKAVATFRWEGTLDPSGNVKEMRKVEGKDSDEVAALAIPEMSRLFPEIDGARDLKIGDAFKDERVVRLPEKLGIAGLENVTIKWTREYTLKSVSDGVATFEVKTTYAEDPGFNPETEKTTFRVSGGGSGEALFEVRRGVFMRSRQPTSMHIEIEAPLRPLPEHPETNAGLLGKSFIDLDLLLTGEQTVKRVWGEEPD